MPIYKNVTDFKAIKFSNDTSFSNSDDNTISSQYSTKYFIDNYVKEYFTRVTGIGERVVTEETFDTELNLIEPDVELYLKYDMEIEE